MSSPSATQPVEPTLPAFMHATTIWNLIEQQGGLAKNPQLCWLLLVSTFTEDIKCLGSPDNEGSWMCEPKSHIDLGRAIIGDSVDCKTAFPGGDAATKLRMLWAGRGLERLAKVHFGLQFIDARYVQDVVDDPEFAKIENWRQHMLYRIALAETTIEYDDDVAVERLECIMNNLAMKKSLAKMDGDRNELMKDPVKNADAIKKLEDGMKSIACEFAKPSNACFIPQEFTSQQDLVSSIKGYVRDAFAKNLPLRHVSASFISSPYVESLYYMSMGIRRAVYDIDIQTISMVRELRNVGNHSSFSIKDGIVTLEVTLNSTLRADFQFKSLVEFEKKCLSFYKEGVSILGFEVKEIPGSTPGSTEYSIGRRRCTTTTGTCTALCQPLTTFCEDHQQCRFCNDPLTTKGAIYCERHKECVHVGCNSMPAFKSGYCYKHKLTPPVRKPDNTMWDECGSLCEYGYCSKNTPLPFCSNHQHQCSASGCKARLDSSYLFVREPQCLLHTFAGLTNDEQGRIEQFVRTVVGSPTI